MSTSSIRASWAPVATLTDVCGIVLVVSCVVCCCFCCVFVCVTCFSSYRRRACELALTRYCHYQYFMVYGIQTRGAGGRRISRNRCAEILQSCGQCRWEG